MGTELTEGSELRVTGHICADCSRELLYTEEVWTLRVVKAQRFEGKAVFYNVIDEHSEDGDFLYEPFVFCFTCWEKLYGALKKQVDEESAPVDDHDSEFECACCESGIREWEHMGLATLGEFHLSTRAPNGVPGPRLTPLNRGEMICLYCLILLDTGHIDMWSGALSQDGECDDCVEERCWRHDSCNCDCHADNEEQGE